MMQCMRVGCDCDAGWQVALHVWQGVIPYTARGKFNCFHVLTPIVLCDEHKDEARPEDVFSAEGLLEMDKCMSDAGHPGLDFDNMSIEFIEMIDGERVEDNHEAVCSALGITSTVN